VAIINCSECGKDVSDTATNCPHCGARVKKPGMGWFAKLALFVVGAFALVMVLGTCASSDPEIQSMRKDRRVIEACVDDMNDPLRSAQHREAARYMCERLRDDFRRKYRREP
jgi:endogenous inhibitor of DNA gyrase (YacG/DUF329 family)